MKTCYRERYLENQKRLKEILEDTFSVSTHINRFEETAISIGDSPRVAKYKWLRVAYQNGAYSDDEACNILYKIHVGDKNETYVQ